MHPLIELADEVAAATGPDRRLECMIWCAVGGAGGVRFEVGEAAVPDLTQWLAPAYTASLDAAMTLVPEGQESAVLHDAWRAVSNGHALHIRFWKRETDGDYAQALARQVTAAALKARAHSTKESDNG